MGICSSFFNSSSPPDSASKCTQTLPSTPPGANGGVGESRFSEPARVDGKEPYLNGKILDSPNLKEFSFAELKTATRNFRFDTNVCEGGFGKVYKGWIDEKTLAPSESITGMAIAIKKFNSEAALNGVDWQTEVNILGSLSHPNLIRLLGFCCEDKEVLLVYEFMPKGSLKDHLFKSYPSLEPLSWGKRLKIAIGAARGLAFLHTSENHVIHRNLKPSNILLDARIWERRTIDKSYNAKISDFGLAKLGPAGEASHVTTSIMGTYGYAAPEYVAAGHLSVKSDVYGFGVVLLELITGLKVCDNQRPNEKRNLVDWAKPILKNKKKVKNLVDARIQGQYSWEAAVQVGDLTLKCLENDPKNRPCMQEVLKALERIEHEQPTF